MDPALGENRSGETLSQVPEDYWRVCVGGGG